MTLHDFQKRFYDSLHQRMMKYGEAKMLMIFISVSNWHSICSCQDAVFVSKELSERKLNGVPVHLVTEGDILEFKFED